MRLAVGHASEEVCRDDSRDTLETVGDRQNNWASHTTNERRPGHARGLSLGCSVRMILGRRRESFTPLGERPSLFRTAGLQRTISKDSFGLKNPRGRRLTEWVEFGPTNSCIWDASRQKSPLVADQLAMGIGPDKPVCVSDRQNGQ